MYSVVLEITPNQRLTILDFELPAVMNIHLGEYF